MKMPAVVLSALPTIALLLGGAAPLAAQEVFRDFTFLPDGKRGGHFSELDPNTKRDFTQRHTWGKDKPRYVPHSLALDLAGATRAEFSVAYWGGHIGTTDQRVKVNGHDWIDLPQPVGTPGSPEIFYRTLLGNNFIPLPLGQLKPGANVFQFSAGPQRAYSFDFGFYWIYSFTVRVHYAGTHPHPRGTVRAAPATAGGSLLDVTAAPDDPAQVARVDFFAETFDFDWDGDGIWREWQYQERWGEYSRHIGTATAAPWQVAWDTRWLPDQSEKIRVRARITDRRGTSYLSPPLDGIELPRTGRSVTLHRSGDVPEKFSARAGSRKGCTIVLPDDLSAVTAARLIVSTWSAGTDTEGTHEIILNGSRLANRFGVFHDYDCTLFDLDPARLRPGANHIEIHSDYKGHALEINWPGPVILLETRK
jgi:hypothetical protein